MLIRYKKDLEKIAMGLLSFMPGIDGIKSLQKVIKEYENNENWHLYLWRDEDILGIIGLRIDQNRAIIQHVSVNPSHRNLGIGKKMVREVIQMYGDKKTVCADKPVEEFYHKCINDENEKNAKNNHE